MDTTTPESTSHQKDGIEWLAAARSAAAETVHTTDVPGIVVAAVQGDGPVTAFAIGADAQGNPLGERSILPVASITKVATALGVLRLIAAGAASLDDPLARYLPTARLAVDFGEGVTLRRLLCHTAGAANDLAPQSAPYAPGLSWAAVRQPLLDTPPAIAPGRQVLYSNTGMGLLALVIEEIAGQSAHAVLREQVFAPLEAEAWLGFEPERTPAPITGDLGEHVGTALEPYNTPWYRSLGFPWGGMVATAEGALRIVRALAGRPATFLPEWLRAEAVRDQTGGLSGGFTGWMEWAPSPWGLGVELKGKKKPHFTPRQASPATFGHIGWSGAAAWHDPSRDLTWSIVGTRTWGPWCARMVHIGAAICDAADVATERTSEGAQP